MKLKLRVDGSTTASELRLLGVLFTGLAEQYAPCFSTPVDEAELVEPEPPSIPLNREVPVDAHSSGPQFDKPKRTRRTKAEIADAAAAEQLAKETEKAADVAALDGPVPTVETEPAANTPATEPPSDTKTYTPAEVQKIAVATAGRFGPEKVKAIIAQYPGAARIADIPVGELAGFVAKLNAVS